MAIEFNLGLVAGSLSSLRPLPFFRRFGSSANSRYKASTGDTGHELRGMHGSEGKSSRKKNSSMGLGTTLLEETVNESQERIIHVPKTDGQHHV